MPPFEGVDTWKQDISNKDDYVWEPAENAVFKTVGKTPVDPTESTKRIKQQMQDLKKRLEVIKQNEAQKKANLLARRGGPRRSNRNRNNKVKAYLAEKRRNNNRYKYIWRRADKQYAYHAEVFKTKVLNKGIIFC